MKPVSLLAAIVLLLLTFILSVPCNGQDKIIQTKVDSIIEKKSNRIYCKTISTEGDTIFVKYGWRGMGKTPVRVGTWFTIFADKKDKEGKWMLKRITISKK